LHDGRRDGRGVVVSRDRTWLSDPAVQLQMRRALTGQDRASEGTIWPWRTAPFVIAAAVGNGGEILGAVVTRSPVGPSTAVIGRSWAVLASSGAVVLLAAIAVAWALARWTVRPVGGHS